MNATQRFLKYVTFDTQSNEESASCPSTENQLTFADFLVNELLNAGAADAMRDSNGYVYGHIPAAPGYEDRPAIGFIAHMDTSPDVSGKNVKPQIITYNGSNAQMLPDRLIGEEIIVSDGTTLLGADDKAGIAEILAACERLSESSAPHGKICICFTPDEEIGRGADRFDFELFGAEYAYTVDGGELGGIDYENFNAASVTVTAHGVNTHPGSAKNIMQNAALYITEYISMLPAEQSPAHTEGREGFYHVTDIHGDTSAAAAEMLIRDFDSDSFKMRKQFVLDIAELMNRKYGEATITVDIQESYRNMKEIIAAHMEIIERAEQAFRDNGIEPHRSAIRGGTDGARLSFEGLPCPDLSAGGLNFHSIYEAVPTASLEKMTDVLIRIAEIQEA